MQLVLISAMVSLVWLCSLSGAETTEAWILSLGVDAKEPKWESYESTLQLLLPPPRGVCCVTRDMPAEERSGKGVDRMTRDVPGEERSPCARHLGLSVLMTFCTWRMVLALLMSV